MMRFFLFVAVAWLIATIVKLVFRSMSQPEQRQRKPDNNFRETNPNAQMDFKNVQDAQFEDITKKEKAPK